jgi:serine/threonine protein kinase/Tol biopolymer transport system component
MADQNWQQLRKIFDDALRQTPEERRKFVNQACGGNETLLREVESLLSSHESAESFMEKPAIARVADQILTENRQFSNGQLLAHYKIIERIGMGGMGEVYLAQDSKLNRKVAIKVLHQDLSSDDQAYRRLLREAQAAASLEHPNICAIYEISEIGDCSFIVMQYVEGETLAERLTKERFDAQKSLDLAIQIAEALAEAHSRGIIHRDIKPANIIVNKKGHAKVLDFGLAKFVEAETNRETTNRHSSGAVMGTVPFMSPEQLRGERLDARTDIFSFGAVFYEMLSARQAFARESNAETISAILNDDPPLARIPERLQPILRKSLMKNCGDRYSSAQDLARDLREAQKSVEFFTETGDEFAEKQRSENVSTSRIEQIDSNEQSPAGSNKRRFYFWNSSNPGDGAVQTTEKIGDQKTAESKPPPFSRSAVLLAALTIFLAGAGVLIFLQFNKTDDSRQFDALRPVRLVSWKAAPGGYYTDYSVSHDGKLIAYSSSQEGGKENIYIKQTAAGEEIRVTKDEWKNISPIWSPDDQRIAYASQRETQSGIYVIPALGGAATPLKIIGQGEVFLRHWSKDSAAIFYEYQGNLFRLDLATQEAAQITDFAPGLGTERQFNFSPDEARIAFRDKTDGQIDIWVMPAGGGERQRLSNDRHEEFRPRWHADGRRILYGVKRENDSQIGLAFTDGRPPVQITRGDSDYNLMDVSTDGTKIFYFSFEDVSDISGVKIETGEAFEVATAKDYENWAEVSPDEKSILFQSKTGKHLNKPSIIVKPMGGGSPTFQSEGYNPHWLPDSRRISFTRWSEAEQKNHLFVVNTANGEEKQLTTVGVATPSYSNLPRNRGEIGVVDFSPDGAKFVFINQKSPRNVWLSSLETGEAVNLTNNENTNLRYISSLFSADGERIVFVSRETVSGKMIFGLWLWEAGKTKQIFSTAGGLRLLGWSASGDEVLLEATDGVMKSTPLDVKLLQIALTGENRIITTFKNIYADTMTLSADGKTVAFTARQNDKDDIWTAAATGGEPKKITANGSTRLYYASPVWSSDGKTIFFDKQEQINIISMFENFK